jgi:hypothetical protein
MRPIDQAVGFATFAAGGIHRNAYFVAKVTDSEGNQLLGPPADQGEQVIPADDVLVFETPGGAGYGNPLERPPEQVREDVLDDFTTIELARDAYGVVFADESTLEIDVEATERLRDELRKQRNGLSLTEYFAVREPVPSSAPASVAANREFNLA